VKLGNSLLNQLFDNFNRIQSDPIKGIRLQDWRISYELTEMITLGIKNNVGGSVYTSPAYKNAEIAEIFLVWEDGKCSRAKVQKPFQSGVYNWDNENLSWRMAAFEDPNSKIIPLPEEFPEVKIADDGIQQLLMRGTQELFYQQSRILSERPTEAQTDANIYASWGSNAVYTSTGIRENYNESRYAVSWSFDSQISEGFAKRRLITEREYRQLWDESLLKYRVLKNKTYPIGKNTIVVLAPSVVGQMMGQYILPNFRGGNILEGQSRFRRSDFQEKKKVFESGLSLGINPLRPYHWGSYRVTAEGVPARQTDLIQHGRLHSPYLSVKDAFRLKASPTAIPAGVRGISLQHTDQMDWNRMLQDIKDGVLILSVLGLHTQNSVTGSFSLAAPSALRIKNGSLIGKTDVRISGNYWDVLRSQDTIYGKSALYEHPYLRMHCQMENL
jgi:PmbA protein